VFSMSIAVAEFDQSPWVYAQITENSGFCMFHGAVYVFLYRSACETMARKQGGVVNGCSREALSPAK
jgi:hypothetical protein